MNRSNTFPPGGHAHPDSDTTQSPASSLGNVGSEKEASSTESKMKRSITPRGQLFTSLNDAHRNITHRNATPRNNADTSLSPKTPDHDNLSHHDDESNKS